MSAAPFLALFLMLQSGSGMEIEWMPPGRAVLKNTSNAAITAYMVQFEYVKGDETRAVNRRTLEAVPQVAHPVGPNESVTLSATKIYNVPEANAARVVCAIFADGRTIGDELCIKRFLDKRRQLLREDLPAVQKIVAEALTQARPDVTAILQEIDAAVADRNEWAKAQQPPDAMLMEARAHHLVQMRLSPFEHNKKDPAPAKNALKDIAETLEKWRKDLESSLPKL